MLNRLSRIFVLLFLISILPIAILGFLIYWIITGKNLFDPTMEWIIYGNKTE